MTSLSIPYMIPLFLGMTYDARFSRPGVDIYEAKYVDNPAIIEFGSSESFYSVVSTMSEVQKALNINGELSMKIKTGMLNVEGKGSYVKDSRDYKNNVEIITTLKYTASAHSFTQDAKPKADWSKIYKSTVLGTHYVSSITYGAEMIASARFVVFNSSDVSDVKGVVEGALNTGGSGTKLFANGTLDKLKKSLSDKANLEISYFGTVPLKTIPNTLEGLQTLIENFSNQIKEANLTDGIPMEVYLEPLTSIAPPEDKDQFGFKINDDLQDALEDFEEKFDELRQSRLDLLAWTDGLPYDLPAGFETQIGSLFTNITRVYEIFFEVFVHMDMTKDRAQLQPAFDAYDYDGRMSFRRFANRVKNLVYELSPAIPKGKVTGHVFTHWGNHNCSAPNTELLYSGFVFSSGEDGIGGTSKYECAPENGKMGYDLKSNSPQKSNLARIYYTKFDLASNPFQGLYAAQYTRLGVPCAKCYSPDSADIAVFPASASCPLSWNSMYLGYVVSARRKTGRTTEYVCLDEKVSVGNLRTWQSQSDLGYKDIVALTTVQSKGSLPSEKFKEGALVRCVVCSIKSNQVTF